MSITDSSNSLRPAPTDRKLFTSVALWASIVIQAVLGGVTLVLVALLREYYEVTTFDGVAVGLYLSWFAGAALLASTARRRPTLASFGPALTLALTVGVVVVADHVLDWNL